jgi:hypothetical protein
MNLFLFPFVYTDIIGTQISNFSSTSLVTQPQELQEPQEPITERIKNSNSINSGIPTNLKNPVVPIDLEERSKRISFGPRKV